VAGSGAGFPSPTSRDGGGGVVELGVFLFPPLVDGVTSQDATGGEGGGCFVGAGSRRFWSGGLSFGRGGGVALGRVRVDVLGGGFSFLVQKNAVQG